MSQNEIHDRPFLIRYNERGGTAPYDPFEVFPPEQTESIKIMARQRARGGLQKHLRKHGPDGWYTWGAGLTVEEADAPGMVEAVKRSTRHKFQVGDWVIIRGTTFSVPVLQVDGDFLILRSYGWGNCTEFHRVNPPRGRYVYGRIQVYKGHVELAEWGN